MICLLDRKRRQVKISLEEKRRSCQGPISGFGFVGGGWYVGQAYYSLLMKPNLLKLDLLETSVIFFLSYPFPASIKLYAQRAIIWSSHNKLLSLSSGL